MKEQKTWVEEKYEAAIAERDQLKKRLAEFMHNHVTRDIKPEGECPSCDHYHLKAKVSRYEKALERIAKKEPQRVNRHEAADMACELWIEAREALGRGE